MKNIKLLAASILFSIISVISCSKEDEHMEDINSSLTEKKGETTSQESIFKSYGIEFVENEDGSFILKYQDGLFVEVRETKYGTYLINGNKIEGRTFELTKSDMEKDGLPYVIKDITDYNRIAAPCDQHPSGESFKKCFKREWDNFCDGLVGCLAQATNPVAVATAITIHCAAY